MEYCLCFFFLEPPSGLDCNDWNVKTARLRPETWLLSVCAQTACEKSEDDRFADRPTANPASYSSSQQLVASSWL